MTQEARAMPTTGCNPSVKPGHLYEQCFQISQPTHQHGQTKMQVLTSRMQGRGPASTPLGPARGTQQPTTINQDKKDDLFTGRTMEPNHQCADPSGDSSALHSPAASGCQRMHTAPEQGQLLSTDQAVEGLQNLHTLLCRAVVKQRLFPLCE